MKVLFVYHNRVEDGYMPQALAVLGGAMKEKGIETKLFDTTFYRDINSPFGRSDREVRESQKKGGFKKVDGFNFQREEVDLKEKFRHVVESYRPDLVAATSTSFEFNSLVDFVTPTTMQMKIPFIVGGSHATVVPEKAIDKKGVDIICRGEGELPLQELAKRIEKKESYYDIPSLWFKTPEDKIIKNKVGRPIEKMDNLPISDWSIIDERHRIRPFEGVIKKYGWFEISRGCPFNCSYCINSKLHTIAREGGMHPGTYRFFKPEEIIKRMKEKKEQYGYEHISLADENMANMPVSDLEHLAELFKNEIGVSYFTQSRPECFVKNPEKAKIMAEMGCKIIGIGIESGSSWLRENILHRHMPDGIVETAVENLKNAGIMVAAYYIIGFPNETEEMVQQTIALHRKIRPERFSVRFLHPFPGTPIRNLCVENGYIKEDYENLIQDASFFTKPVLNLPSPPHPTKERLIELKKEFENY